MILHILSIKTKEEKKQELASQRARPKFKLEGVWIVDNNNQWEYKIKTKEHKEEAEHQGNTNETNFRGRRRK